MSAISGNFECPICLEDVNDRVTLNCTKQHELCHSCAKKIFGAMKEAKPCPFHCGKKVTAYIENSSKKSEEAELSDADRSFGSILMSKISKMKDQGYNPDQIKMSLQASYNRYKHPSFYNFI